MKIILMRHGDAFNKEIDPQKGLSPQGMSEAKAAGKY